MAKAKYVINVADACLRRSIENPYQLWQKVGGSKATTSEIWHGKTSQISLETINKLHNILGIVPTEYIRNEGESGN